MRKRGLVILERVLREERKHSERAKERFCEEERKTWGDKSAFGFAKHRTTHSRKPKSPQNK